ncbi:MAG TPA: dihydrofolate reductase family protein [Acidimicrobiales bacterium]
MLNGAQIRTFLFNVASIRVANREPRRCRWRWRHESPTVLNDLFSFARREGKRGEAGLKISQNDVSGKELLVIGSAHLSANLAEAGLLDELRVMICPIVLGQGRSLFEDLKRRVSLTLFGVRQFNSGNLVLTYRPSSRAS